MSTNKKQNIKCHFFYTSYAVFGLGSSAYPLYCAFACAMDVLLNQLGGERLVKMETGDDMGGQEEAFQQWAKTIFKVSTISIQYIFHMFHMIGFSPFNLREV